MTITDELREMAEDVRNRPNPADLGFIASRIEVLAQKLDQAVAEEMARRQ
jgi:hypothetical protein